MPKDLEKDVQFCIAKHTFNGDGSRGAYGDYKAAKCVTDRVVDRHVEKMQNGGTTCTILKVDNIKYDNPALNSGTDVLVSIFRSGGIDAVNNYLSQSSLGGVIPNFDATE